MSEEMKRTYVPFGEWKEKSKQTEYTEETPLLSSDGTLLVKGWARRNVFSYERLFSKPNLRKKRMGLLPGIQRQIYGTDKLCKYLHRRICRR